VLHDRKPARPQADYGDPAPLRRIPGQVLYPPTVQA
jgi:hypothetical protein